MQTFRKKGRVLPSYISPNELLSITTFDEPEKDAVPGVINSKAKAKLKDNEKDKTFDEETEHRDNDREMDTENGKQSLKKRKYSEKSVTDESDIKVKRKKKEVNQSMIDQQNEKEKISKEGSKDKDNICDNEIDAADNNGKQSVKKGKHVPEKFVTDENDIKVKKKRKNTDSNITYQQNEKEKVPEEESEDKDNTYDNKINAAHNNDRHRLKKEKHASEQSLVANESDVKVKKRKRETAAITDQQDEKERVPKEESEDKNNSYDNEIDTTDNNSRQGSKKRRLVSEKSYIEDKRSYSNIENQEIPNKNRNKITEKKKRRHTINDITITEDVSGEAVKKECQKTANKNKATELECLYEGDGSNEANTSMQTEKHSTKDLGMRSSDIEEISVDERKKKKNRKKRSKIQDNDICSKMGLQVMAKLDWKRLRNRYLDLQRYKMSQLKLHLRKAEVERGGIMTKNGWHYDKTGQNNTLHDKSKYESDNGKFPKEEKSYGRVNFAPGIIVKIEMDEPCTDLQSFKVYYH